jgi:5,10-methenyltetrahydrofolate synthetase
VTANWNSKSECRAFYKAVCAREFSQGLIQNQKNLDQALNDFLKSRSGRWAAYKALPQEAAVNVSTAPSLIQWFYPRMRDLELEFFAGDVFVPGLFGVMEPSPDSEKSLVSELQGVLVPGLVFNKNGSRMGKGKGFYDKALADFSGIKVGICFDFQVAEKQIPMESHDIVMDYLVTDSGLIDCQLWQE